MTQKGSKRPSPNHHKAICPKRSASRKKVYTQFEKRLEQRSRRANTVKENTKTKAEKKP
jgi:hypothetical protein